MKIRWAVVFGGYLLGLSITSLAAPRPASPPSSAALLEELRQQRASSPVGELVLRSGAAPTASAATLRPTGRFLELRSDEPDVRVHLPIALASREEQNESYLVRTESARQLALKTLAALRHAGLPEPADDGDGEIDIYLLALDGAVDSTVVLDEKLSSGRGLAGHVLVDVSNRQPLELFESSIVRSVARLAFAAWDAEAPSWWVEPSVSWVESMVLGESEALDRAARAHWSQPERGLETSDPLLQRSNWSLFRSLQDESRAARMVFASWKRLAQRATLESATQAIAEGVRNATGLSLEELQLRAALAELADGLTPNRWSLSVGMVPQIDQSPAFDIAPLGAALIEVVPDPAEPVGTRISLITSESDWIGALVAHRPRIGWDRIDIPLAQATTGTVVIPWADYDRACIVLVRPAKATGLAKYALHAEGQGQAPLFALSSMAAIYHHAQHIELRWSSAWEQDLLSWAVERAPTPDGPWEIASAIPVPAVGLPRVDTQYAYHDETVPRWSRIFYRIVALTHEGLRVSGASLAVRRRD